MKISFLVLAAVSLCSPLAMAAASAHRHLELDLRASDYSRILSQRRQHSLQTHTQPDPDEVMLNPVLAFGERNLQFLKFINAHRDLAHQISLTSEATERATPIESPRSYNAAIAYENYAQLLKALPEPLVHILTSTSPFPTELPIPEADYIAWGLKADLVYETAARWLTLKPELSYYTQARKDDVRGYYFLSRDKDLSEKLSHWANLDTQNQAQYREWLIGTCYNSEALEKCQSELNALIASNADLGPFYAGYSPASKAHYESYFVLDSPRADITFTSQHPEVLKIPFVNPDNPTVLSYLKDNIEDEWRWDHWNLKLDFGAFDSSSTAHLRWQAGVTPHVEDANTIVMDENQPMSEYDSKWTIRHEFGHIMGFPDCYIEFYDPDRAVMTSYQLDITNLMCSRRGKFKQIHLDELKRAYLRPAVHSASLK